MKNLDISFIILSYNEEIHLARLLSSISSLNASTYVLDSYSTDSTPEICRKYNINLAQHHFENHPKQWDHALNVFQICTPWVICLDADQIITAELLQLLVDFRDETYRHIDGIYFNRKNYFKGQWIRHGGYYPKYLLKMFRYNKGWSDLNENMDHRFHVTGETLIWKSGHLIEENLKENRISFWITKHNHYSDLLALEEFQKQNKHPSIEPKLFGSPNNRKLWAKNLWIKLPLYLRPTLYFIYRLIVLRGFMDGKTGIIFHFLQGFWFRLMVDIKLEELNENRVSSFKFIMKFTVAFCLIYGLNILFISLVSPGGIYLHWLDQHFNYIRAWREFNISSCAIILKKTGHQVKTTSIGLTVTGYSGFRLIYSCLGYGIMSCFAAFIIAFQKPKKTKFVVLITGLTAIQLLNISRLALIARFYKGSLPCDHHLLFNISIYLFITVFIYKWTSKAN